MVKYKNPDLPVEERVEDLMSRMTLEEKLQQMHCSGCVLSYEEQLKNVREGKNTADSEIYTYLAVDDITCVNEIQRFCVEKTRLGIPLFVACEGTHGLSLPQATIFPTCGCLAATFDESYAYKMGAAEAKEARALGYNHLYAPNVDLLRDPRWGRSEENFGEDPYLSGKMGASVVRGIQDNGVAATAKHYIAYGQPESGLNCSAVHMGERDVREYFLLPFAECVKAGVSAIMPTYSELDGVPVHLSKLWMHDVLREELGFNGFVITDYGMSWLLYSADTCVESLLDVGKRYLEHGAVDMEACLSEVFGAEMRAAIERGEVSIDKIDRAVRRILTVKIKFGLFEHPYFDENTWKDNVFTAENRKLCYEIASKGTVLLKNDGVLPLENNGVKKIALIGPNAEIAQLGDYCYYSDRDKGKNVDAVSDKSITLKEALIALYGQENVVVESGCGFANYDENQVERARTAARKADVVIFAGGHNSISVSGGDAGGEEQRSRVCDTAITSGEGYDTADTDIYKPQKRLLKELAEVGKPLVFVLYGGKPTSITDELPLCNAVLLAFGVGSDGNSAVADILRGSVVPSGKLPFSMPRSVGHLPCYYNHKHLGKGTMYRNHGSYDKPGMDYVFDEPSALFEFGYGLSYTTFEYSGLTAKKVSDTACKVNVKVKNTGGYDAEESVLVFSRNMRTRTVTPIVKKLVAYKRIELKKGEEKEVEFDIDLERFSYIGEDMKSTPASGDVKIFVDKSEVVFEV